VRENRIAPGPVVLLVLFWFSSLYPSLGFPLSHLLGTYFRCYRFELSLSKVTVSSHRTHFSIPVVFSNFFHVVWQFFSPLAYYAYIQYWHFFFLSFFSGYVWLTSSKLMYCMCQFLIDRSCKTMAMTIESRVRYVGNS